MTESTVSNYGDAVNKLTSQMRDAAESHKSMIIAFGRILAEGIASTELSDDHLQICVAHYQHHRCSYATLWSQCDAELSKLMSIRSSRAQIPAPLSSIHYVPNGSTHMSSSSSDLQQSVVKPIQFRMAATTPQEYLCFTIIYWLTHFPQGVGLGFTIQY